MFAYYEAIFYVSDMSLNIVKHPLVDKILTDLRDENTQDSRFRILGKQVTYFLLIEATKNLATKPRRIRTPLSDFDGIDLAQSIVIVPILRSGLAMLEPAIDLFQDASVGYIGLERNEKTAVAGTYYCKFPVMKDKFVMIVDPMLATGHSAELAIEAVLKTGPAHVVMVSIVAAPEGVKHLEKVYPNVPIYAAAIDEKLNDKKFIVPGLGDFGDRAYGTK